MHNIFKRIIIPTIAIIVLFFAADEMRLPLGLCATVALIGGCVTVTTLLRECKKMQFKTTDLVNDNIVYHPLKKVYGQIRYKDKKLANKTQRLPKSASYTASRLKRK